MAEFDHPSEVLGRHTRPGRRVTARDFVYDLGKNFRWKAEKRRGVGVTPSYEFGDEGVQVRRLGQKAVGYGNAFRFASRGHEEGIELLQTLPASGRP